MLLKIKPPPSDRLWLGFYDMPQMELAIEPLVSTRAVKWSLVTSVIEKRINESLEEYLVLPNMEELGLPPLKSRYEDEKAGIISDAGTKHPLNQPEKSYSNVEQTSLTSTLMSLPRKKIMTQPKQSPSTTNKQAIFEPQSDCLTENRIYDDTNTTTGSKIAEMASLTISPQYGNQIAKNVNISSELEAILNEQPPPLPPPRTSSKIITLESLKPRSSSSLGNPSIKHSDTINIIENEECPVVPINEACPVLESFNTKDEESEANTSESLTNDPNHPNNPMMDLKSNFEPTSIDTEATNGQGSNTLRYSKRKSNSDGQLITPSLEHISPENPISRTSASCSYDQIALDDHPTDDINRNREWDASSDGSSSGSSNISVNNSVVKRSASSGTGIMKTLKNSVKTIYNYPSSMTGTKHKIRSLWTSNPNNNNNIPHDLINNQDFQSNHHHYYSRLNQEISSKNERDHGDYRVTQAYPNNVKYSKVDEESNLEKTDPDNNSKVKNIPNRNVEDQICKSPISEYSNDR